MTTTHTSGPWHIGIRTAHSKRDVYGTKGELIALADEVFTSLAVAQANAQLIAAAPAMLAALLAVDRADTYTHERGDALRAVREAITQAIGENAP